MRKGILFVTSGPSGSGKTTLCRMVEQRLGITHSISYTTRPARPNEIHGRDYYFVSDPIFDAMIQRREFLEWAQVHGYRYGTALPSIQQALEKGQDLILDLDIQGAQAIRSKQFRSVLIFIDVPRHDVLAERLGKRGTEKKETLQQRLAQAEVEREAKRSYTFHILNEDLEKAYAELAGIIEKERSLPL